MGYASALKCDPARTYRTIDLAGRTATADGPALVQFLYDEAGEALRIAALAAERHDHAAKSERVTRATAILFALEAGLDFEKGGDVAETLARFYAGVRGEIVRASIGDDGAPFREAAESLAEIAAAWKTARAG